MPDTIENPILNSPFSVPERKWQITHEGIEQEPVGGRRSSTSFLPVRWSGDPVQTERLQEDSGA